MHSCRPGSKQTPLLDYDGRLMTAAYLMQRPDDGESRGKYRRLGLLGTLELQSPGVAPFDASSCTA